MLWFGLILTIFPNALIPKYLRHVQRHSHTAYSVAQRLYSNKSNECTKKDDAPDDSFGATLFMI